MPKLTEEQKELNRVKRQENKRLKEIEEQKQRIIDNRNFGIKDMRSRFIPEPTRLFEVGEKVECGAHQNIEIVEVFDGGKFYEIHITGIVPQGSRNSGSSIDTKQIQEWFSIFKKVDADKESFFKPNKFNLNFYHTGIQGLLHNVYFFGLDFNANYQRELVWTDEDKTSLIDSIMNDLDIGKFILMKLPFESGKPNDQIVDGKQRLTTICEFYEDRFVWRGNKYSELSSNDRWRFRDKNVSIARVDNMPEKDILELFLNVNTTGKPIAIEHLDKVLEMYNSCE